MIDPSPVDNVPPEMEEWIRSAERLPRLSADLRLRVLQAAMAGHQGRRRRYTGGVLALVILILLAVPPPLGQPRGTGMVGRRVPTGEERSGTGAEAQQLLASAEQLWGTRMAGSDWALVESYSRLRQDHLRMLRQAF